MIKAFRVNFFDKLLSYGVMVSKVLSADVSHLELSKGVMVITI